MAEPVVVLCPECGEAIEVRDVAVFLLALHLANDCSSGIPNIVHEIAE